MKIISYKDVDKYKEVLFYSTLWKEYYTLRENGEHSDECPGYLPWFFSVLTDLRMAGLFDVGASRLELLETIWTPTYISTCIFYALEPIEKVPDTFSLGYYEIKNPFFPSVMVKVDSADISYKTENSFFPFPKHPDHSQLNLSQLNDISTTITKLSDTEVALLLL